MSGTDRVQRWRERQHSGRICISIEIGHEVIEALVDTGLLEQWDEKDRPLIAAAVEKVVVEWTESANALADGGADSGTDSDRESLQGSRKQCR